MSGFSYIRLVIAALFEPFIYHPMIVMFSIRGYLRFIMKQRIAWGEMKRKGFQNSNDNQDQKKQEGNKETYSNEQNRNAKDQQHSAATNSSPMNLQLG